MLTKALAYIGIHEWMLPLTPLKSPPGGFTIELRRTGAPCDLVNSSRKWLQWLPEFCVNIW